MEEINKNTFKHKMHIEALPTEPLVGIKVINCKIKCEDDIYRPVIGVQFGFLFFNLTYLHMMWK